MGVHVTPSWRFGRGRRTLPAPMLGSMAALESGSDTLSIITTNVFFGTIAATESGADTLAWSGGIHVRGSITAQEFGDDTAVISGPAVGTLNTPLYVNSSTTGTKPFCIGQAFVQGEVPANGSVSVTGASAESQVTPKNRWPDESLKFAIIAGTYVQSVASTEVELTISSGSSGGSPLTTADLKATGITASFNAGAFGSASWSGTDWDTYDREWVSGHMMSSWLYRKQIGADAHLVAWMEVRLFAGGAVEVLPWVENGYVAVTSPTSKSATYSFTLGGSQRFAKAMDIVHHTRTVLIDSAVTSYWLGTDPGVTVRHSADYLMATELVPSYDAAPTGSDASITDQPSTFTPFQKPSADGSTSTSTIDSNGMGGGGAHDYIGILPEWDVVYLTGPTSISLWKSVQWNSYSLGRYAIHYRDENTNRPLLFASHATRNLSTASEAIVGVYDKANNSETSTFCPNPTGTNPPLWVYTHHPSPGYLAYLITGRAYFLEETQFAATVHFLRDTTLYRQQAKGIFRMRLGFSNNTTRGVAWQIRTLAQAACITPDADTTMRANFVDSLKENINFYKTDTDPYRSVGLGFIQPHATTSYGTTSANSYGWYASWQQHYFTAAFGYAKSLKIVDSDATALSNLGTMVSYLSQSVVNVLGGSGSTEYLYRDAGAYAYAIWPTQAPNFSGAGPWHADMGDLYDATFSGAAGPDTDGAYAVFGTKVEGGDLRGSFQTPIADSGSEYGILMNALSYAVKHSATGAVNGYRKLYNAPNWYAYKTDMDAKPVNAIVPEAVPAWRRGLAVNEWTEILGSSMSNTPPTVTQLAALSIGGEANRVNNWNGFALDSRNNILWGLGNGGHGDWYGNEVMRLDLNTSSPVWDEWLASSLYTQAFVDAGKPASARHYNDSTRLTGQHSYYNHQMLERQDRVLRVYSGSVSSGAGTGFWTVDGYDITTAQGVNGTDPAATFPDVFPGSTSMNQASGTCRDPDTEKIYFFPSENGTVRVFTPATSGVGGSWANVGTLPAGLNGAEAMSAFDTRRGRILVAGQSYPYDSNVMKFHYLTVSGATWSSELTSTLSGEAKATLIAARAGGGMVYVPYLDAYLVRLGPTGSQVIKIDASTFACTFITTTGGSAIPATDDVDGPTLYENVYNKFLFVPHLRGVIYYPEYSANLWFLRLY
jgi:hypothetical protein